jgi:hypothetical protein
MSMLLLEVPERRWAPKPHRPPEPEIASSVLSVRRLDLQRESV